MPMEQVLSDRDSEDEVDDDVADFEDRRVCIVAWLISLSLTHTRARAPAQMHTIVNFLLHNKALTILVMLY